MWTEIIRPRYERSGRRYAGDATAPEHKQMTSIRVRMSLQRYSASLTFYNTSASNDPTSGCDIS
jgi:hypothetical protein